MGFAADVEHYARVAEARMEMAFRLVGAEVFRRVIMRTPVDTGRLRGAWQASLDEPISAPVERLDPAGDATVAEAVQVAMSASAITRAMYLTNNLPYARRIEYEGYSQQAPAGMVRITAAEFQDVAREVGAKIAAGEFDL